MTRGSLSALSLLARGTADPSYRAQSISGPYGAGKSALAMYFARLLDKDRASLNGFRNRSRRYLGEIGAELLPPDEKGYIPILATGARESLSTCLLNSLTRSLQKSGREDLLRKLLNQSKPKMLNDTHSTRQVVGLFESLARLAVDEGAIGVVVIVDELGKLLEHAALQPEDSDLDLLQEMAEAASRSHEHPLWFITILHQDFSHYASRLGRRHQREWFKVQQRFFDVPYVLDDTDALQLVAAVLNSSVNKKVSQNSCIRKVAEACTKLAPKGAEGDFETWCMSSYPIHPTSLVLLPALFKRFGQNERSLFSFLSADEPFSLREWVRSQEFDEDDPPFLRFPQLFGYTLCTLIGGRPSPYFARTWTEVEDTISRLGDASPVEVDVLKSIGLLGLVGDATGISASRETLHLALASPTCSGQQIGDALRSLEDKRLIVFRRFRNAYRLWEGSDIDIGERLAEAHQALPPQSVSLLVARDLCPSPPLVAQRHSFRTGTLRFFSIIPSTKESLLDSANMRGDSDGYVVQCLVQNNEEAEAVAVIARQLEDSSVIVIVGKENDELAEAARDVAALEGVKRNTPSLAGDRVARQELSERRLEAETAFRSEWNKIFEPGRKGFKCYWNGKEYRGLSKRELSSLLSDACDAMFPYAPIVKNELINRRNLSSAAAAARRNIIEAMICNSDKAGLGITGYPPQRSIYESLLLGSGIHRESEDGKWTFSRPGNLDPGLQKAWDHIIESVGADELKPKSVAELFDELSAPPYGIANGFVPVLLCACLLLNSSTMAIYEDGVFLPELAVPVMERLMRRPEHFSIVAYGVGGERSAVVERFARGFGVDNGVLPVVQSLYARIGSLPQYTLTTRNLSSEALGMRETILRAKSPERLLFIDLPVALGYQPFEPTSSNSVGEEKVADFFTSLNKAFLEFIDCYPQLLQRIKRGIFEIFGISGDSSEWLTKVSNRASKLYNAVMDSRLRMIMVRARDTGLGETEYLESVGAGIVGQVPSRWSKADEDNFWRLVPGLAYQVRAVESTQRLNSVLEDGEDGYLVAINDRNGEVVRQIVRFSVNERDEIEGCARVLSEQTLSGLDQRILLAVLTEAARKLANQNSPAKGEQLENEC
jgi:hypothetical protein